MKKELPCLSHVVLIGDRRKFLSCLVTLKLEVDNVLDIIYKMIGLSEIIDFLTIINNYLVNLMLRVNAIVDVTFLIKNKRSNLFCDSRRLSSFCNVATYLPRLQDCNVITIVTI